MTDRTSNIGQQGDSTVGKPSTSTTYIEQFRRVNRERGTTHVFQESADLFAAVCAIEPHAVFDVQESKVLVRHNIDGEGIHVVFVDARSGCSQLQALTEIIDAMVVVRDELALLDGVER